MGHASIQITLDTYSHVATGLQPAVAQRFDDILLPYKAKTKSARWQTVSKMRKALVVRKDSRAF